MQHRSKRSVDHLFLKDFTTKLDKVKANLMQWLMTAPIQVANGLDDGQPILSQFYEVIMVEIFAQTCSQIFSLTYTRNQLKFPRIKLLEM